MQSTSISIISNSRDDSRFKQFEDRFLARLRLDVMEVIRIADAASMAEGYNRGASGARGDWLFFCHDDIGLLGSDCQVVLREAMLRSDVFGPCGTTRLVSGNWYDSGKPYNGGAVVAPDPSRSGGYRLEIFGDSPKCLIQNVQALDGLFIACRRRVFDALRGFDEYHLKGFHTYDVDFTFRAYLAGFRSAIANRLLLLHDSKVFEFSKEKLREWEREQAGFERRLGRYFEQVRGDRIHTNISLNDPEEGPAARLTVARKASWNPFRRFGSA
jgi:GT2 family glycosyltransferase